jgi:hypothetical protein
MHLRLKFQKPLYKTAVMLYNEAKEEHFKTNFLDKTNKNIQNKPQNKKQTAKQRKPKPRKVRYTPTNK